MRFLEIASPTKVFAPHDTVRDKAAWCFVELDARAFR
jgi:hypothetical protein